MVASLWMGVLGLLPALIGLLRLCIFQVVVPAIDLTVVEMIVLIVFVHRAAAHHKDVGILQIAYF